MDKTPSGRNDSCTPSLIDLLKKYTTRVDERETLWKEGTRAFQQQHKAQTGEIEKLKETVHKLNSKPSSISDHQSQTITFDEDKTTVNYKAKWEESEAKCRQLEKKCRQLESGTIKQLQDKIQQLEQDSYQNKVIKERIAEICSCRQLTNVQLEQLKSLINSNGHFPIEPIANKNDFHQQTIKLREILVAHNNELLSKLEEMMKKKRKRNQDEDDGSDDGDDSIHL